MIGFVLDFREKAQYKSHQHCKSYANNQENQLEQAHWNYEKFVQNIGQ